MLSNVSFVLQGSFGLSILSSSFVIGIIPSANIIACGALRLMSRRMTPLTSLRMAMSMQVVAGCTLLTVSALEWQAELLPTATVTVASFWLMIFANGLCFPGLQTFYLEPFQDIAGLASGVNGFCHGLLGAGLPSLASWAHEMGRLQGLQSYLGCTIFFAIGVFWSSFGLLPPAWARTLDAKLPATEDGVAS